MAAGCGEEGTAKGSASPACDATTADGPAPSDTDRAAEGVWRWRIAPESGELMEPVGGRSPRSGRSPSPARWTSGALVGALGRGVPGAARSSLASSGRWTEAGSVWPEPASEPAPELGLVPSVEERLLGTGVPPALGPGVAIGAGLLVPAMLPALRPDVAVGAGAIDRWTSGSRATTGRPVGETGWGRARVE
ncbi:MAG: hypothetical protein JWM85_2079 [Acidimicrobiaceae bacterium]|nr:hypothetical protein [Acidimicrobiaceae bacterium]